MTKKGWIISIICMPALIFSCSPQKKDIAVYYEEKPYLLLKDSNPKRIPPVPAFDIALLKLQGKELKIDLDEEEEQFLIYESHKFGIKIPPKRDIKKYLYYYAVKNKKFTENALQRGVYFIPLIKQIFKEHNLPPELAYLPVIESGFNPFATSKTGAAGIWQFVPSTAKRFGLKINSKVDERRDPYKSTVAAAKYLQYLYKYLKKWDLAIAAYNCGEGCIKEKLGIFSNNFWDIKHKLPKQTREYVPRFYAIALIIRKPEKYGIHIDGKSYNLKRKLAKRNLPLKTLSKIYSMDYQTLKLYNAHFIKKIAIKGYYVNIPTTSIRLTLKTSDKIKKVSYKRNYLYYKVKKGDTLYKVAKKFNISINKIKQINKLKKNTIYEGQILKIPSKKYSLNF
ncbi:MAG: transglycosylase SLT domain-containing protein [Aquificae bacterium]|nr:transglycosylase SLT domain-containing protein [Aquificota bacterium]